LFLAIWNTFDENAAARSATGLTLVHGLGQSAEVAMRFFLFVSKKIRIHNFFSGAVIPACGISRVAAFLSFRFNTFNYPM